MLQNTFCHIPGIKQKSEEKLWHSGVLCWGDALNCPQKLLRINTTFLKTGIEESFQFLEQKNAGYFSKMLPVTEAWRLYQEFADSTAFLDIETNGSNYDNFITAISLYDGWNLSTYVHGRNLDEFVEDVENYKLLVTYNGKCFDIPFIEQYFDIELSQGHIDLRFILHSLGVRGGLKGCERKIGLDRKELNGVNGYMAVLLWNEYMHTGNESALETLLAYNVLDTVNLHTLMVYAHNVKLGQTPFAASHQIGMPEKFMNPFEANVDLIHRIMHDYGL
jgi:uncharacterized protein